MAKVGITNLRDLVHDSIEGIVLNAVDVVEVQNNADIAQASALNATDSANAAALSAHEASISKLTAANILVDVQDAMEDITIYEADALASALDAQEYMLESALNRDDCIELLAATRQVYDHFDDRYLGGYASNPIKDNDGHDIVDGAMYWNTMYKEIRIYDQTNLIWYTLPVPGSVLASNLNLAEVADKAEARFNLDVYSIAEVDQIIADSLVTINADLGAQVTGVLI
jgi:hypothetical protein